MTRKTTEKLMAMKNCSVKVVAIADVIVLKLLISTTL